MLIFLLVHEGTDAEVDEDGLVVVVDHDVVRLDISVDDFDDFVAVVERLEHVDEVESHVVLIEPHLLDVFLSPLSHALLLQLLVYLLQLIAQTSF